MVRRLHAISEHPKLAADLLRERHDALKQFTRMGFIERDPNGQLHAFGEPAGNIVLRGVINNFPTLLKGGYKRERERDRLSVRIGDTICELSGHSRRYLDNTYGRFFREIDGTLAAVGITRALRSALATTPSSQRAELLASPALVPPLYDAYRILRLEGYSQKDLTA